MDVQPMQSGQVSEGPELLEAMLRMRIVDERLAALGEAGTIGFLPRTAGREAAHVGTLAAMRDDDWLFPTHNDWAVGIGRGMSVADFAHRVFGNARDALEGKDMPSGMSARSLRIASVSAPAGTHLPHAVGLGWAARRRGEDVVGVALFDDVEVDSADFHTGLNFAGVMRAPTVFVCHVGEGGESAAEHAVAYGLASARCRGADPSAVKACVAEAIARAAAGEGATVIDVELGDDPIESARAALGAAWTRRARGRAPREGGERARHRDRRRVPAPASPRSGASSRTSTRSSPHTSRRSSTTLGDERRSDLAQMNMVQAIQRRARVGDASRTIGCSCSARTSGRWAACSASRPASTTSSGRTASSTRRSPRAGSSARRSGWRSTACAPSPRSSSPTSSSPRSIRS